VRPLDFDEDQHKILESELKALYVCITRARCNVWVADMSEAKRAPMYEYWSRQGLATVVATAADAAAASSSVFVKQVLLDAL
jgi:ATP-dependent exoDNAse (exonuclease V) beta subunit